MEKIFEIESKDNYSMYSETKDDCLMILIRIEPSGWGKYVIEMTKEWCFQFEKTNTKLFFDKLPGKNRNQSSLLNENFCCSDACEKIKVFCMENGINYSNERT